MLIDFTVGNFRSIKQPVTISLFATKARELKRNYFKCDREPNIGLLKSAVIYGANASGKSNVLKAIDTFQDFVVESTDLKIDQKIKFYRPFKLDNRYANAPTTFEIEFISNEGIRYRYLIEFNEEEILKESLVFYPKGQEANLFLRIKNMDIKFGDYFTGPKKPIEKQLLKNNLFLSKAANSNNEMMEKLYSYVRDSLCIASTNPVPVGFPCLTTDLCVNKKTGVTSALIGRFLKVADTGIEFMEFDTETYKEDRITLPDTMPEELKEAIKRSFKYRPMMHHKVYTDDNESGTIGFDIAQESDGTSKLYELSGIILHALLNGLVVIADEFDNSLHPHMARFIVELFHNPKTNPYNAQLVFVTHDITLLNNDLFRRDQIWMTEKDQLGATSLYSLSEFDSKEVRNNIPFDKWYMSGRFGALPIIGELEDLISNAKKQKD